jgi:hypothetical protein
MTPDRSQLPTIGHIRAQGMSGFALDCLGVHCHHSARIEFAALQLPDYLILIEIPKARRFVCAKCGGRGVSVRPDWLALPSNPSPGLARRMEPPFVEKLNRVRKHPVARGGMRTSIMV